MERTKCKIWTRCVGYLRPIDKFNEGKLSEYKDRRSFKKLITQKLKHKYIKIKSIKYYANENKMRRMW